MFFLTIISALVYVKKIAFRYFSVLLFHDAFGDFHGFLKLSDHDIPCCQTHIMGRVHAWECWSYYREVVCFFVRLVKQLLVNVELNHFGVGFDLAKMDGIVVLPHSVPVISEEGVEELASLQLRVALADVRDHDGIRHSSAVPKDV